MKYRRIVTRGVYILCILTTCFIWYVVVARGAPGLLTVTFFDVGQGDAIFIESPSGAQMLIDGGRDASVLTSLATVMPFWDRTIDVVLATHPDADHIAGLVPVVTRYSVVQFIDSGVAAETELAKVLYASLSKRHVSVHHARRGDVFDLGDGVFVTVLFPDRDVSGLTPNDASVVVQLTFGEHTFMLTGDSPDTIERYLVSLDGTQLHSTVLKAGHHGSHTSSDTSFIGYVAPEYVVFSRGCENRYGHPHEAVQAAFARFAIPTLDTCLQGDIRFTSDGTILTVDTQH